MQTYQLGTATGLRGQTQKAAQIDVMICRERAREEANTDARVAGSFIAGLTIIGAPIAIAEERHKSREVWATCMTEKGYSVKPPDGSEVPPGRYAPAGPGKQIEQPPANVVPAKYPVALPAAEPPTGGKNIADQLTKLNDLKQRGLISEEEYATRRKAVLDSL